MTALRPFGSAIGRRLFAELGPQEVLSEADAIAAQFAAAHDAEIDPAGTITVVRRGRVGGTPLTGVAVAAWCRDAQVGAIPDDPLGRLFTDDAAMAQRVAEQVADLVRAAAARVERRFSTLTLEESVAARLLSTRTAWTDREGRSWWRDARPADPVLGGSGPTVAKPLRSDQGRALLDLFRRTPPDAQEITLDRVRAAGLATTSSHERPAWPDVLAEVRQMAGAESATASTDDGQSPTAWLRRRARTNP